ncbi:hypothetical protein MMC24_004187 [Lignoscripta atroalba]|nr:hypothetical protein [Lignoscripta atroalba]
MVGVALPGRPGNLTPDQEVKLRELWKVTLKVFGMPFEGDSGANSIVIQNGNSETASQEDQSPQDKKKKRRSMFSRKHHDGNKEDELDGGGHTDASIDSEDKYGQRKEFNRAIASQSPEDLRKAFWGMVKNDHPDGLLLRFLRARKWDVERALIMLISTMQWRMHEMHVDEDVIKKGEGGAAAESQSSNAATKKEGEDFMAQLRLGKSFLHGTDREGRPLCFVRARLHKQGEQSEASLERYTVYVIETARLLLSPPVDTAAVLFDMTGFSLANMDYSPVKFMIKCFEANYPESLGVILVHKAPWVFQGIWSIIKGWLDPVVAAKVHFTKNLEELEHFVPRDRIIKELGGDDPWTYRYEEPRSGENDKLLDDATRQSLLDERASTIKEFESTTQDWIQGASADKALQQKRDALAERLRAGYWRLDPYVRARTLYDRTGMINEGGRIDYYPSSKGANGGQSSVGLIPADHNPDDVD